MAAGNALPYFEEEAKQRLAEGQKAGGRKAGRGRIAPSPIGDQAKKRLAAKAICKATEGRRTWSQENSPPIGEEVIR
jgi:hypothetical protein